MIITDDAPTLLDLAIPNGYQLEEFVGYNPIWHSASASGSTR